MSVTLTAYDTYINADIYFENRLHVAVWKGATTSEKIAGLLEATQRIEQLRFAGYPVDEDQVLSFPRYYDEDAGAEGDEEVPDDIKIATYELAFALIDGADPDMELENLAVVTHAYGNVRMTRSSQDTLDHIAAGIPCATAWRHLLSYLAPAKTIKLRRVS